MWETESKPKSLKCKYWSKRDQQTRFYDLILIVSWTYIVILGKNYSLFTYRYLCEEKYCHHASHRWNDSTFTSHAFILLCTVVLSVLEAQVPHIFLKKEWKLDI